MSFGNRFVLVFACITLIVSAGCSSSSQKTSNQARESSQQASLQERELISAALQGNVKRVEAALNAGTDANAFDETLGTPLGGASYSGSLEAVRLLTARGAHVNAKDSKGMTPLMNATLGRSAGVVRFLIAKGADVNIGSPSEVDGRRFTSTALLLARGSQNNEIVTLLIQAGAKE
jgi:ankyrin repeat protein